MGTSPRTRATGNAPEDHRSVTPRSADRGIGHVLRYSLALMKRAILLAVLLLAACKKEQTVTTTTAAAPAPQATAAVTVRDPHSFARPDEVRVEHIALDLAVDFARKQLSG